MVELYNHLPLESFRWPPQRRPLKITWGSCVAQPPGNTPATGQFTDMLS